MSRIDASSAESFAQAWADAWNRRDLAAVLAHFDDGVQFRSPKAAGIVGTPVIEGKAALERYWGAALKQIAELHFTIDGVVWDDARRTLVIRYRARLGGSTVHAAELLDFDDAGHVIRGSAFYGAAA